MGLLKNIFWKDNSNNTIVYRFDMKNDYISKGSLLTVREGQNAVFATEGKMADVFLPGRYKLDTKSIPVLTKLMSWKYGFENPFRSDVYFVSTKQFTNQKWGTPNPITIRDKDYGAVRVRGFGTYSFKVKDAHIFLQELSGSKSLFTTEEVSDYLRSIVLAGITDALGESKISVLDLAGNLDELNSQVMKDVAKYFVALGLELTKFTFESFTLPEALEKALDQNTAMMMRRGTTDVEMRLAQAEALKEAAKNPGMAGSMMGAGMGMSMGMGLGQMFNNNMQNMNQNTQSNVAQRECPKCKAHIRANAKFCPECGEKLGEKFCPACGANVKAKSKFCPECGNKM